MTAAGRWCTRIVLTGVLPIVGLALLLGAIPGAIWGWAAAGGGLMPAVFLWPAARGWRGAWV
ncbi:MAG TPA: hypothetical protein DGC76_02450, partial [Candidatus Accumulibacter sp.]|nr:hypothetical protein [Accumulibacter sp.]